MLIHLRSSDGPKTTASRFLLIVGLGLVAYGLVACGSRHAPEPPGEDETVSRTEFTNRIENFFEYEPLKAGKPSQFRIHLTDLTDGSPVEQAEVVLIVQAGNAEILKTKARAGKVAGIYVAEVSMAKPGQYQFEFHVKNSKLDERLPVGDFTVE